MAEPIERPNYFELEYLGADDFTAEQTYHRDMRRRHNVAHHLWGIVIGMELSEVAKSSGNGYDVYIRPGFAIDGFGREVIVEALTKLDAQSFASFTGPAKQHEIWIGYRELLTQSPGFGYGDCSTSDQNKRVEEEFRIYVDPDKNAKRDPIVVDGKNATAASIPDDQSVPYQELPEEATSRWLIRLGTVTWDADNGQFVQTPPAKQVEGRVYTGIVGDQLLSPSDTLRLARRAGTKIGTEDDSDFASVNGRLSVDGTITAKKNVHVWDRVALRNDKGDDENVPLWIRRIENPDGADLRIHIGAANGQHLDKQRLTIGPGSKESTPDGSTESPNVLVVKADDTVDITTGTLSFGAKTRQMINLWKTEYAIGVQSGTLYNRTAADFAWFRGGKHDDGQGNAGGGTLAMRLNSGNVLTVYGSMQASNGDVLIDGGKLQLRLQDGGIDTDELSITRFRRAADQNDLRVIIGDNLDGQDALSVGPVYYADNQFKEAFRVTNVGDGTFARNLSIGGDLKMTDGKAMTYGAVRFPIDIVMGRAIPNLTSGGGSFLLPVQSNLAMVSDCQLFITFSDIGNINQAIDAEWSLAADAGIRLGPNLYSFKVNYYVGDTDGYLYAVAWMAVFRA